MPVTRRVPAHLLAVCCVCAVLAGAGAGTSASGVAPAMDAVSAATGPDAWDRLVLAIRQGQRDFHRALTQELRDVADGGGGPVVWSLIVASFLYGVFHAAGPGHGKAVLSAYLLTHREAVRRGVGLAFAASFCQGLVALAAVYGLVFVAGLVMSETQVATRWLERSSYLLVALLGAWLTWRGLRAFLPGRAARQHHGHGHDHGHGHGHSHGHAACGHSPVPPPAAPRGIGGTRASRLALLGLVLSIGLRPCSGALVVLVFAQVAGVPWAGVAAVAAISLGTGTAVAALAYVAVNLRDWAGRIGAADSPTGARIAGGVAMAGGAAVAVLGVSLFQASFAPLHPLGL